jgi:hypothetical protein
MTALAGEPLASLVPRESLDGAIITIEEHHPGQTIWVEAKASE